MTKADYRMLSKSLGLPPGRLKRMGFSLLTVSVRTIKVSKEVCLVRSITTERTEEND
ncbi:MAG: hypothetical protein RL553_577 [Planctomycetota bacterium]|jgi:hypothetical protein